MKKVRIFTLFIGCIALLVVNNQTVAQEDVNSCIECHGNSSMMEELGFPQFVITNEDAQKQTKMPASCTDCHLGNRSDRSKEGAHKGLLRLYYVKTKGFQAVTREKLEKYKAESITPRGQNPLTELLPTIEKDTKVIKDPDVNTILFHDKNPEDLSFNYPVLEKTCGICHQKEVEELKKTAMGHNEKQKLYQTWTEKKVGPHNCGVWFADGYEEIAKNTKVSFTKEMSSINQKACNVCHVGCLDCHYAPKKIDHNAPAFGPHSFTKNVSSRSCYGGGRGSICHAGPEDRRRGAGYIGGPFSNPLGALPDIHYTKGILCTDCHDTPVRDNKLLHGQVKRQTNCSRCHASAVKSVTASVHRQVSCEACHIQDVGGYTGTFWGPGKMAGIKTPFFKSKEYYGVMKEPILIKDQRGKWIPVKPYPMAVMNQKTSGGLKPGLAWRFPSNLPDLERTDDAYAFVGLLSGLPGNDNALAWIQMDKMSHKYGKARGCKSCHSKNGEQYQEVLWKYADAGADPFDGKHVVIANRKGLFIKDMQATTEIKTREGWKIEDFAPWYYLKDMWHVQGDFSIPQVKKTSIYEKEQSRYEYVIKAGEIYHRGRQG